MKNCDLGIILNYKLKILEKYRKILEIYQKNEYDVSEDRAYLKSVRKEILPQIFTDKHEIKSRIEKGCAIKCSNLPVLAYKIDKLIADEERFDRMRKNVLKLAQPKSAKTIVRSLLII